MRCITRIMTRTRQILAAGAAAVIAVTSVSGTLLASSHREAPLIAGDPRADITNLYPFDDNVLYWIKVDNDGDGTEDVTYEWRFTTHVANPDSFLYSGYGPI